MWRPPAGSACVYRPTRAHRPRKKGGVRESGGGAGGPFCGRKAWPLPHRFHTTTLVPVELQEEQSAAEGKEEISQSSSSVDGALEADQAKPAANQRAATGYRLSPHSLPVSKQHKYAVADNTRTHTQSCCCHLHPLVASIRTLSSGTPPGGGTSGNPPDHGPKATSSAGLPVH